MFSLLAALERVTSLSRRSAREHRDETVVAVGMGGEEFCERNGLDPKRDVDRQPAGVNFYSYDWATADRGTVTIEHGTHGFSVPDALGVMGAEDADRVETGFLRVWVSFGFLGGGEVSHAGVRDATYEFLADLQERGWSRWHSHGSPRLRGREAFEYMTDDLVYSAPLDYEPTLEEWLGEYTIRWSLHADGVFLTLQFRRNSQKMEPDEPGEYYFKMNLESRDQRGRSYFEGEDRDRWEALWPALSAERRTRRAEREAALREAGATIDESYTDPELLPDD
ncbi:hypothetical protein [Natronobiforma cellulositropha]|uniref:hypothetical protein n=1 Tax=Natronobiforma cellulositropha TaxID=1679076 RepID=UPI0021D5A5EC|nr:hypothetical protein [Natronobiforma cellulositropha]